MSDDANVSWEHVDANPHLERDMGYCLTDWEVFRPTTAGEQQLVFLPPESDSIRDDAFIVAAADSVVDPYEHR